tara:strand:+ start:7382 stop:8872 length:1491 start_codon:yes stop_codon:yes gene_type:complete
MALTLYMLSTPRMSTGYNTITATTNTTGVFKFRYWMRVEYWISGELSTKVMYFTIPKNHNGAGVFNMSEIYKNMVTPMIAASELEDEKGTGNPEQITPIHNLPFDHTEDDTLNQHLYSKPFMRDSSGWKAFQGNCNKAYLQFREMYATTPNGIPTLQGSTVVKEQFVFYGRDERKASNAFQLPTIYWLMNNGSSLLTNNYKFDNSVGAYIGHIGRNQYMTMSFVNGHKSVGGTVGSDTYEMFFRYYNSAGVNIGNLSARNEKDSGGKYGGTDGSNNQGRSVFLTIGAGLYNLDDVETAFSYYSGEIPDDAESTSGTDIAYYEMYMRDSSAAQISRRYRFYVTTPCERYEEVRIAYLNQYGVFEYINLNKEKKTTYKVKRNTIEKPIIHGDSPSSSTYGVLYNAYPTDMPHQGTMVTHMTIDEEMTLYTQNLDDSELDRINDLIMSPQIHMLNPEGLQTGWIALICKTTNIDTKIRGKSKLYSYALKFAFAQPKFRT